MEMPKAVVDGACAVEDGGAVEGDGDRVGGEGGGASVIAEGADGNEGAGCEGGEDVGGACRWWEHRKVEKGGVGGGDGAAVR